MHYWHDLQFCTLTLVHSSIAAIFLLIILAIIVSHIQRYGGGIAAKGSRRRNFWRDLIYFIFVFLVISILIADINNECYHGRVSSDIVHLRITSISCYSLKNVAMWFDRTYLNFKDSSYHLSKYTVCAFMSGYRCSSIR